jgi:hypothetical protein
VSSIEKQNRKRDQSCDEDSMSVLKNAPDAPANLYIHATVP